MDTRVTVFSDANLSVTLNGNGWVGAKTDERKQNSHTKVNSYLVVFIVHDIYSIELFHFHLVASSVFTEQASQSANRNINQMFLTICESAL